MKPKDMTLGELVCEYIHTTVDLKLDPVNQELHKYSWDLRLELLHRFFLLEMSIPEKLEWGIPEDKAELIKNRKSYAEEVKKKRTES